MKKRGIFFFIMAAVCLLFTVQPIVAAEISSFKIPGKTGQYQWDKALTFTNPNKATVIFKAKTIDDIYVCFAKDKRRETDMYEFTIGGWGNTRSVIKRRAQGQEIAVATRNGNDFSKVVRSNVEEYYWASIDHGTISAGKGQRPGRNIIVKADDRHRFYTNLKYVAFSSWSNPVEYSNIRLTDTTTPVRKPPTSKINKDNMPARPVKVLPVRTEKAVVPSLKPMLVGEYLFDQVSLADSSGMNNTAKRLGSKNVPAKRNSSFCTSYSQGTYLEIPLNDKNRFSTNSFSVSLWIKTTDNPSNPRGVVINYLNYTKSQWSVNLSSGGRLSFALRDENKKGTRVTAVINDGKWHHIVGIRDRENKEIRMYVDGKLFGRADDIPGSVDSGQSIWVGNHLHRGFQGCIDDIRLYKNTLSDKTVQDLYNK